MQLSHGWVFAYSQEWLNVLDICVCVWPYINPFLNYFGNIRISCQTLEFTGEKGFMAKHLGSQRNNNGYGSTRSSSHAGVSFYSQLHEHNSRQSMVSKLLITRRDWEQLYNHLHKYSWRVIHHIGGPNGAQGIRPQSNFFHFHAVFGQNVK